MKRATSWERFSSAKTVHNQWDGGIDNPLSFLFKPVHRKPDPLKETYLTDAWVLLKPAINILFNDKYEPGVFDCNSVLRAVVRACYAGAGRELHGLIKKECEPHVSAAIQSLERCNRDYDDDNSAFLLLVEKCWLDFKRKMMYVSDLAMYESCDGLTLLDMGDRIFQEQLSLASQTLDKVIAGILGLITADRLGITSTNLSLLKNLMDMFKRSLDVFEKPLLDSTSEFYAAKAEQVLQQSDISQYLKFVERSFGEEQRKCNDYECYYFFVRCWSNLMKVVGRELLEVKGPVLEKGFTVFMDEDRLDDLRRMHNLLYKAGLTGFMDRMLRSYIREKGAREGGLLKEFHARIDNIWQRCFNGDQALGKSIRKSFKDLGFRVPGEFETIIIGWEDVRRDNQVREGPPTLFQYRRRAKPVKTHEPAKEQKLLDELMMRATS